MAESLNNSKPTPSQKTYADNVSGFQGENIENSYTRVLPTHIPANHLYVMQY